MATNSGRPDSIARLAIAALAAVVAITLGATTPAGIVLLVVAAVLAVTGALGTCPIYRVLGINTCSVRR